MIIALALIVSVPAFFILALASIRAFDEAEEAACCLVVGAFLGATLTLAIQILYGGLS